MNKAKLQRRLDKIEKILDKVREDAYNLPIGTMRRAKASRNYDYYAQEKMKLKQQIDETESN